MALNLPLGQSLSIFFHGLKSKGSECSDPWNFFYFFLQRLNSLYHSIYGYAEMLI